MLNVGLGGTLYQDIPSQRPESQEHVSEATVPHGFHHIELVKDGFLGDIFKEDKIFVNSLHHQGIKALGKNLKVAAYAKDGLIEAIEDIDGRPIYGLQFHPERMIGNNKEFIKIFQYFLEKSKGRSQYAL